MALIGTALRTSGSQKSQGLHLVDIPSAQVYNLMLLDSRSCLLTLLNLHLGHSELHTMFFWHGTQYAFLPVPTSPYRGKWLQIGNGIGLVHN